VTGQPRDNKPYFMKVLHLTNQSSQRGLEQPRPTRSKLTHPNTSDTDLGLRASVQTTTGRRRSLISGRSILAPVEETITAPALTRGARPRTRLVPATSPSLVSATTGATLRAPRGIPIPNLHGSRRLLQTITGARTELQWPPKGGQHSPRPKEYAKDPLPQLQQGEARRFSSISLAGAGRAGHERAKSRPARPAEGGSPVAAGGCSAGARAGYSRPHGTTPAGPPPEHRGPQPVEFPPR